MQPDSTRVTCDEQRETEAKVFLATQSSDQRATSSEKPEPKSSRHSRLAPRLPIRQWSDRCLADLSALTVTEGVGHSRDVLPDNFLDRKLSNPLTKP